MRLGVTLTFKQEGRTLEVESKVDRFGHHPQTQLPDELSKLIQCAVIGLKSGIEFYIKEQRGSGVAITYYEPRFDQ